MKLRTIDLASVTLASLASMSQAAIVFSGTANNTGFTVDSTTSLTIVHADISYNNGENNAVPGGPNFWPVLDDGSFGGVNQTGSTVIAGDANSNGLLYKFTAGAATIGSISVYSGWANNGRIEQHYSVYTTTDVTVNGSSTWTLLATVDNGAGAPTAFTTGSDNSLRTTVYDNNSSILASGITGLRFNFSGGQQNGGVGYKEIDVQVIPEPSAALLGGLGMLALLRRRR
jgi:hypothetical protein